MVRKIIRLQDGSGGVETSNLIKQFFSPLIEYQRSLNKENIFGLDIMDDSAFVKFKDKYLVITTDSYTVNPLFFPGGDLGKLSVTGTINDLAVAGADPFGIVDAILIEEGTDLAMVEKIIVSMRDEIKKNNIVLLGGDLKVMPRNALDKIVITTTGIGFTDHPIMDNMLKEGDKIIVTGSLGEHGAVITALQFGVRFDTEKLQSDVASVYNLMKRLREKFSTSIHAARDPTRGGLSMVLNDWAEASGFSIIVEESSIPISPQVKAVSEILGLDPFHLPSEGKVVLGVDRNVADEVVDELKSMGYEHASIVGEARKGEAIVVLRTFIGGERIMDPPSGLLLPRIC